MHSLQVKLREMSREINKPHLHLSIPQAVNTPVVALNLPRGEARVAYAFSPVLVELRNAAREALF